MDNPSVSLDAVFQGLADAEEALAETRTANGIEKARILSEIVSQLTPFLRVILKYREHLYLYSDSHGKTPFFSFKGKQLEVWKGQRRMTVAKQRASGIEGEEEKVETKIEDIDAACTTIIYLKSTPAVIRRWMDRIATLRGDEAQRLQEARKMKTDMQAFLTDLEEAVAEANAFLGPPPSNS